MRVSDDHDYLHHQSSRAEHGYAGLAHSKARHGNNAYHRVTPDADADLIRGETSNSR